MIGRTVSHYRIVSQLGAGGMGVVYRAEDVRLGREVALKFVSDDYAHDTQALQRLRSEARAASALNHANICTIYDIGEDDGHPFIVMELMKGQPLRERLAAGPLKVHHVLDIGIEIADALQTAHGAGIIHRDIKPGNIFLTERGGVKVLDFGLAKLTPRFKGLSTTVETLDVTSAGVTLGTISYMSPEQATAEELDGRTDLFSLGVVLYEAATGRHPFAGKTSAVTLAAILDKPPVAPVTLNPELPLRLQEVISNCLEKDRELRYQSAADLRADLKRLRRDIESGHSRAVAVDQTSAASSRPSGSRSFRASADTPAVPVPLDQTVAAPSVVVPARRRWPLAAGLAAVVAIAAVSAYALWSRTPPAVAPQSAEVPAPSVATPPVLSEAEVQNRLALAEASLKGHNPRAAAAYAAEVLAVLPQHGEATRLRRDAQASLEAFDVAIAETRQRLGGRDIEGAARALERARALDPTSPAMIELSARLASAVPPARPAPSSSAASPPAREREPAPRAEPTARVEATPQVPAVVPAPPPAVVAAPPAPPPPAPAPSPVPAPPAATTTAPAAPASEPVPQTRSAPATVAPPEKRDPPPPAVDPDDTAIRRVTATYARAIETKDLALFRSVKPNLSREEERRLQEGFRAVTSQRVTLTVLSILRQGDTASVAVRRLDTIEAGGRQQTRESQQTLSLQRAGSAWVIVDIR